MWTMSVPMFRGNGKGRGFILGFLVVGGRSWGSCCGSEVVGRKVAGGVGHLGIAVELFFF